MTYVLDTCRGFDCVYNSESLFGQVVNIGMKNEISIKSLVQCICRIMGVNIEIRQSDERIRPKNSEVDRLVCDNSNLLKNTDWVPEYNLDKGLSEFILWMKSKRNLENYKSEVYNV